MDDVGVSIERGASQAFASLTAMAEAVAFEVVAPDPWPAGVAAPEFTVVTWSDGVSYEVAPPPPRRGSKSLTVSGRRAADQDAAAVTVMPRSSHPTAIFVTARQRGTLVMRFDGFSERQAMEVVHTLRPVETGEKSAE